MRVAAEDFGFFFAYDDDARPSAHDRASSAHASTSAAGVAADGSERAAPKVASSGRRKCTLMPWVTPACVQPQCSGAVMAAGERMLACAECGACWQSAWWHTFLKEQQDNAARRRDAAPLRYDHSVPQGGAGAAGAADAAAAESAYVDVALGEEGGPSERPPMPPPGWVWPREGDVIEVEVAAGEDEAAGEAAPNGDAAAPENAVGEGAGGAGSASRVIWARATVTAVLVDGWFKALIVLPDGSDSWDDWFTWREENTDWRRVKKRPRPTKHVQLDAAGDVAHDAATVSATGGGAGSRPRSLQERALANIRDRSRTTASHRLGLQQQGTPQASQEEEGQGEEESPGGSGERRKVPRELANLGDFFTNGKVGIP